MRVLHYTKTNNLSQLHDELLAALPVLRGLMIVEGTDEIIRLTVPDDADQTAIAAIVNAHVPRATPTAPPPLSSTDLQTLRAVATDTGGGTGDLTLAQLSQVARASARVLLYQGLI